jgi:hypothetical protein
MQVGCSFNINTIYKATACKRIADSGVKNPKAYALRESSYLDVGCLVASVYQKATFEKHCYGWNFIASLFIILLTSLVSGFITPTSLPFYQHHRASSRIHHANNIVSIGENSKREEEAGDDSIKKRIVVIGNGMVGQRFIENLIKIEMSDLYFL